MWHTNNCKNRSNLEHFGIMIGVIFQDLQKTQLNNILPMESTAMFKLCAIQTKNTQRTQYFIKKKKKTALETPKLLSHTSYSSALSV